MIYGDYEALIARKKQDGGLTMAFGCFDIFHYGHLRFLQKVREKSTYPVVVGILDDALVRVRKGDGRPVNSEVHRAEIVDALKCVDGVIILSREGAFEPYRTRYGAEDDAAMLWTKCLDCLAVVRPTRFYYSDDFPVTDSILKLFADCQISAETLPYTQGISSTALLKKASDRP